jgi:hypothetical protein
MRRNEFNSTGGNQGGRKMRFRKILAAAFAAVLISVLMMTYVMPVSASPIVIDEDSCGSWEDTFKDTDGIETWDNLDLTAEGLRLTGIFEENFTGIDGSLPDQKKWFILDDGQILEISNNYLRTEIDTRGQPTWGAELVRTRDDFSGSHVLTWRQNILAPTSGAVYNFLMVNASDNSRLLGINQNWAGEYWVVNFAGGGNSIIGGPFNGWFDHKITYDNGFVEFYLSGGWEYSATFAVSSVKYEFGAFEQIASARIFTDDILITSNITSGNVTSTEIQLPADQSWDTLTLSKTEDVPRNQIKVSILDGMTYVPIPGYEDLTVSDMDISGIDKSTYPTLRLRAHFSGDGISTPILRSWEVTWIDSTPPAPPTGLTVINPWTGYSLLLSWDSNSEPDVRTYSLYSSTDNATFNWIGDVTKDKLHFDHMGLTAGVRYYYRMTASDEVPNESSYSEVAEGIPDTDMDNDGIGDTVDPDKDGDTVPNPEDDFPDNEREWRDTDGDGIGDNADTEVDTDADGDGFSDILEEQAGSDPEDASSVPADTDDDGIVDIYDQDDDNDGHIDVNDDYPYDSSKWRRPNELILYALIALVLLVILVVMVVVLIVMTARSRRKEIGVPQEESPPPPPEE